MDLETLRKYCLSKKGAYEDFPFDDETLVFKVSSKMFGLTNIKNHNLTVNLKCDPLLARDLRRDYPCIKPGYHMNKEHWNTIELDGTLDEGKVKWLIDHSYELVYKGLKKSEKLALEN